MSVLGERIVKAAETCQVPPNLEEIFTLVCGYAPPAGGSHPDVLRRNVKETVDTMCSREIGHTYDALKNRGLL